MVICAFVEAASLLMIFCVPYHARVEWSSVTICIKGVLWTAGFCMLMSNVCLEICGFLLAALCPSLHSGIYRWGVAGGASFFFWQVHLWCWGNCQLSACAGVMCAGVALPLAATLQHLCLHVPRRSRAALSVVACITYFLALISVGNPPTQPHPFWAPVAPSLSWDR